MFSGVDLTPKRLSSRLNPHHWGPCNPELGLAASNDDTVKCQLQVFRIQHSQCKYSVHKNEKRPKDTQKNHFNYHYTVGYWKAVLLIQIHLDPGLLGRIWTKRVGSDLYLQNSEEFNSTCIVELNRFKLY